MPEIALKHWAVTKAKSPRVTEPLRNQQGCIFIMLMLIMLLFVIVFAACFISFSCVVVVP